MELQSWHLPTPPFATLNRPEKPIKLTDVDQSSLTSSIEFKHQISEESINAIRDATNKVWALGNDRFKRSIQEKLKRRVEPVAKGWDRRSEQFRINGV